MELWGRRIAGASTSAANAICRGATEIIRRPMQLGGIEQRLPDCTPTRCPAGSEVPPAHDRPRANAPARGGGTDAVRHDERPVSYFARQRFGRLIPPRPPSRARLRNCTIHKGTARRQALQVCRSLAGIAVKGGLPENFSPRRPRTYPQGFQPKQWKTIHAHTPGRPGRLIGGAVVAPAPDAETSPPPSPARSQCQRARTAHPGSRARCADPDRGR